MKSNLVFDVVVWAAAVVAAVLEAPTITIIGLASLHTTISYLGIEREAQLLGCAGWSPRMRNLLWQAMLVVLLAAGALMMVIYGVLSIWWPQMRVLMWAAPLQVLVLSSVVWRTAVAK